jgi:hypothetical protein
MLFFSVGSIFRDFLSRSGFICYNCINPSKKKDASFEVILPITHKPTADSQFSITSLSLGQVALVESQKEKLEASY